MAKGVLLDEVWSSLLGRCLQRSGLEQIEGNDAEIGGNNAILGIQGFNGLVAVLGEDAGAFGETGDSGLSKRLADEMLRTIGSSVGDVSPAEEIRGSKCGDAFIWKTIITPLNSAKPKRPGVVVCTIRIATSKTYRVKF